MGMHKQARVAGGGGAFIKIGNGEVAEVAIDTRKDAIEEASHDTKPPRPCTGGGCALCAAGVKRRVRYRLEAAQRDDGQWVQRTWGVSPALLRALGRVTPEDSKCRVEVQRIGDGLDTVYRLRLLGSELSHVGPRETTTEREPQPVDADPPVTAAPHDGEFDDMPF